jgi:hypothetical protein
MPKKEEFEKQLPSQTGLSQLETGHTIGMEIVARKHRRSVIVFVINQQDPQTNPPHEEGNN